MQCIAHRGFAGVNPENTVAGVRAALQHADAVEVDLRRCGSGELVVCHDETVDRTTGATGPVTAFTAAELAALSVEGSDAGVPSLADVLDVLPADATLHAELKERGLAGDLEAATADAAPDVVVSSFDPAAVEPVSRHPTALATSDAAAAVDRAADLGCEFLHPEAGSCTRSVVARAHEAGLAVNAWTVTDPAETRRLRTQGVDGVITDYPECCPARV